MRHRNKKKTLGRTSSHRAAMLTNMATSLIMHKRIFTTVPKAKELRRFVEPIITASKEDTTSSRRLVFSKLKNKYAVTELFQTVSEKVADRPGGYTRILKTGHRLGDNASMCFIELVDFNENMLTEEKTKKTRTRRSRRKSDSSQTSASAASSTVNTDTVKKDKAKTEATEENAKSSKSIDSKEIKDTKDLKKTESKVQVDPNVKTESKAEVETTDDIATDDVVTTEDDVTENMTETESVKSEPVQDENVTDEDKED